MLGCPASLGEIHLVQRDVPEKGKLLLALIYTGYNTSILEPLSHITIFCITFFTKDNVSPLLTHITCARSTTCVNPCKQV